MKRRQLESLHTHSTYIAEFYNTLSNLPFIILGLVRLYCGTKLAVLNVLLVAAGICSGIHHCFIFRGSIILDWIPIASSIIYIVYYQLYMLLSAASIIKGLIALAVLYVDHEYTIVPVPFGHVAWHLLAAFAVDSAYAEM